MHCEFILLITSLASPLTTVGSVVSKTCLAGDAIYAIDTVDLLNPRGGATEAYLRKGSNAPFSWVIAHVSASIISLTI